MNPIVSKYLDENRDRVDRIRWAEQANYRNRVVWAAGITEESWIEVSCQEYMRFNPYGNKDYARSEMGPDNQMHYYVLKKAPIQVSEEEFAEIEKTFTPEELEAFKADSAPKPPEPDIRTPSSGASTFFIVLGIIMIIGGLIVAILGAIVPVGYHTEFSFITFLTSFLVYIIYGCFCFALSVLFKDLRTIVNLLKTRK